MDATKEIGLRKLLDTLSEVEIDRFIVKAKAALKSQATTQKATGMTLKTSQLRDGLYALPDGTRALLQNGQAVRLKADAGDPAELVASLRPILAQMSDAQYDAFVDALDAARDEIEGATNEPAESDEAGMLPLAVASKKVTRQPRTLADLYAWSQGRF